MVDSAKLTGTDAPGSRLAADDERVISRANYLST
jgi:hypothetical protein